jgi:addiction module HigA family antidote
MHDTGAATKLPNIHPGEVLLEEFLKPLNITQYRLAHAIGVQETRLSEIIKGKRAITADTAIRLGRFFSVTPQFWLNLQTQYDLEKQENAHKSLYSNIHAYSENGCHAS